MLPLCLNVLVLVFAFVAVVVVVVRVVVGMERSIALFDAHASPIVGFGPVNLSARSLAWGMARKHAIPSFYVRGACSR